ncbi:kinase-like domain-containing protein [Gautieria morchelliformis]|nr:kinase-like domain-containing protein [Gautieria morchelliformis]
MECEALQSKHQPGAAYVDIARSAFKDVGMRLGFKISEGALDQSIQCLLQLHLYPDGFPAIAALHARGYKILGFSSLDAHTFTQYFQRSVPAEVTIVQPPPTCTPLYSPNPQLFPDLLSHCRCIDEEIQTAQILVVTAAPYRTAEPANTSGFPTALIKRAGGLESNVNISTAAPTVVIDGLSPLCKVLESVPLSPPETAFSRVQRFRVNGLYQSTEPIGSGSFGVVSGGFHVLTGDEVAIKDEMPTGKADDICVLPYEAQVYRHLHGHHGIPSLRWSGMDGGAHVMVLDRLGPNLQDLRRVCRGQLSLKTVMMIAAQMLDRIEFAHSRGIILRDVKPENFAMGLGTRCNVLHMFDLGLAKLFWNSAPDTHIPFREGRIGLGTPRYASHNIHFGREQGRRDDIEAMGNVLLFLLHGRLPWQGIYAPSVRAKLLRIGEMKAGSEFADLLLRSPPEFTRYFEHCRNLAFEERPNYQLLKEIFQKRMEQEHWSYDDMFDWVDGTSEKGTLLPDEYRAEPRFIDSNVDFDW